MTERSSSLLHHLGIVNGDLIVAGAASVQGIVGSVRGDDGATVALDGIEKGPPAE